MKRILFFSLFPASLHAAPPANNTINIDIYSTAAASYRATPFAPSANLNKFFGINGSGVPGFYTTSGGGGPAAFADITGAATDNASLVSLFAPKANAVFTGTFTAPTGTITNSMLAGGIAASKLTGTDIATVGTVTTGTWNGSAISLTYGGTGATTAAGARTNLGLAIGTDVQAFDSDLTDLADGSLTGSKVGSGIDAANLTAGTVAAARLGSGSGGATKFLREDNTWQTVSAGGQLTGYITTDQPTTSGSATNVTGASFSVGASEVWSVEFHMGLTCSAGGANVKFAVDVPASATVGGVVRGTSTSAVITADATLTSGVMATASGGATLSILIQNSTNAGTVQLQFASGNGTDTATVKGGQSYWVARKLN
ncbi:MAG TPA: hypothetical protein VG796_00040 [Verrucomicrobiales bacterium]|jgi:hypothetical protein|nr:hypothetical protein [Verrucomicrobiales bacterium]